MPWTLYRYILKDLLKVLALCTAVLMVVISVAAAIKPISDGLLDPAGLVRFVTYMFPAMLGFALPFASAFASTMVFCRMAADNEIVACRAGGMGYRTILLPVAFLGLLLTLGLFYMGNWVAPSFYLMAEQQLERDMTRVVVSQVQKRQPVNFGNLLLYADQADDKQEPPVMRDDKGNPTENQPQRLIILKGVAVGKLDEQGNIHSDSTAQQVDVLIYRIGRQTWVTMQLKNFMFYDVDRRDLLFFKQSDVLPVRVPNPFKDRLHFLSWPELQAMGERPERFDRVAMRKQKLVDVLTEERLTTLVRQGLTENKAENKAEGKGEGKGEGKEGKTSLTLQSGEQTMQISAPRVEQAKKGLKLEAREETPVRVDVISGGQMTRRLEAKSADVDIEPGDPDVDPEPRVKIVLHQVEILDQQLRGRGTARTSLTLSRARWPSALVPEFANQSAADLLVYEDSASTPAANTAAMRLREEISLLGRKIVGRLHGNAASALGCELVLLLGAILSLHMRGTMPLVVYFWSFLLATAAVVIARSGENIASESVRLLIPGIIVIWAGNMLLTAILGSLMFKLSRS
ncbi:MAG: LptF/LptG family permease [Planctomycetota bacterium]|nr:LptF/LptG family permease [Planctomycetota bacterium]